MTASAERLTVALSARYRLERELGQGGMATVYLAQDIRHQRKVALKVLRPELAAVIGAERFLKEIETTANLQHPHILPLFDSGVAAELLYYVMPFVEGETLRSRLTREKQLPIADVVRIASEVAGALDYAHRRHVIHRDIKPENILLQEGRALVADFGIALAVVEAGGSRMTQTGMSLGTPQYMSPEQAAGEREISARSDLYALGCVTYEMLTGEPPFTGVTAQAIVARLLSEEPRPIGLVRKNVPEAVEQAVLTALEKLPADRFGTAREFASALAGESTAARPISTRARSAGRAAPASRKTVALRWIGLGAALAAGLVAGRFIGPRGADPAPHRMKRFLIQLPANLQLRVPGVGVLGGIGMAIAPDASRLVFATIQTSTGRPQLFIRPLDGLQITPIPGTEGDDRPFFSPDGAWIGFMQNGKLRKLPAGGGPIVTIADLPPDVQALSWGSGGEILFSRPFGGLWLISADGGEARRVATPDSTSGVSYYSPVLLPDGETALATLNIAQVSVRLVAISLRTGDTSTVLVDASAPHYVPAGGGRLVYLRLDGTAMAAPFDPIRKQLTGPPIPLAEGVQANPAAGVANFDVALDGTFVFQPAVTARRELVLREPDGRLRLLPTGAKGFRSPRFSPDGRQIAVTVSQMNDNNSDIWVYELERETLERLTFDGGSTYPEYTTDGRWVVYGSLVRPDDRDILRIRTGGGGVPETVVASPGQQHEGTITPDGSALIYREIGARTRRDIWLTSLNGAAQRRPLAATEFDEHGLALSRDGKWLAYQSDATGRFEVYVQPLADRSERWQISPSGGSEPRWDHSGRALYYRNADTLFTVPVETAAGFRTGPRRALFTGNFTNDYRAAYDVSPDGRRFVLVRNLPPDRPDEVTVVLHSFERPPE